MFFVTHRKAAACTALATWFVAFAAVPALHLARHAEDHVHLPNGGVLFLGEHEHEHEGDEEEYDLYSAHDRRAAEEGPLYRDTHGSTPATALGFDHGRGSLSHLSSISLDGARAIPSLGSLAPLISCFARREALARPRISTSPFFARGPPIV